MNPAGAPAPGGSTADLEQRVRSLILADGSQEDVSGHGIAPTNHYVPPGPYMGAPGHPEPVVSPTQDHAHPASRQGRKRLNQAQRRQMSTQLSIPVETRPSFQQQDPVPYHRRAQPWQPPPHQPHQMAAPSYAPAGFGRGTAMQPQRGRGHSHRGHFNHGNMDQFGPPPHQQHHQHGPSHSPHPPTGPSQGGWRQGAGPPHYTRRLQFSREELSNQSALLDRLCFHVESTSGIQPLEIQEKEVFRRQIEQLIRQVITDYEQEQAQRWDFPTLSVELKCFGSLSSGFATQASDMDLALLSPFSVVQPDATNSPIPRLLEKALLDAGMGARLLTRTRVPIIKLCERPPETLYRNLLAQREKWEKGLENENQDSNDEDEQDNDQVPAANGNEKAQEDPEKEKGEPRVDTEFEVPSVDGGEPLRLYLRQAAGSSLESYYSTAKRVLRKAGGRDVRTPTVHSFTELQWEILNRVCQAFVHGLAETTVRERLESFPSLSFKPAYNRPDRHSLATTFTQIEGEHLLYSWSVWMKAQGVDEDPEGLQIASTWSTAQNKRTYGDDPMLYNKELQVILDRIKKVPSIQIASLEQGSEESPSWYYGRANRAMEMLRDNQVHLPRGLELVVIEQYVAGIRPKEIRSAVEAYVKSADASPGLNAVAHKHKSLQLVKEFTKALEKDLYDPSQTADIGEYVKLLQSDPVAMVPTNGQKNNRAVIPVTKKMAELVARIKALQDPRQLAPNQSRYKDHLEFPKSGAGVQCDINFSAYLALQNTLLLRCYSHTDPRVRPMVLFIKSWAKKRGINSGYRGTLSSYGYVLMVIHYLVNVEQPFVCPNLQALAPPMPPSLSPMDIERTVNYRGYDIRFWRNEEEIMNLARMNQLNSNSTSIGGLLRGFFEYFAQTGPMSSGNGRGFEWTRDVLSLRTLGGLLSKQDKGWTGAKTVYEAHGDTSQSPSKSSGKGEDVKEVRMRYLFAIEDPFETDHNVARTVTHNGIVSIRDEFRRAWRIIKAAGNGDVSEDLLQDASEEETAQKSSLLDLINDIHGSTIFDDEDEK